MKTEIRAGAELDLLTQEEMRTLMQEFASGYLRPPDTIRDYAGVTLDGSGDGHSNVHRVQAGYTFTLTRMEFKPEAYTAAAPFSPTPVGGIDVYVDGQWRDGYAFGGSTGGSLPAVYTQSVGRAIEFSDGSVLSVVIAGGPASTSVTVSACGFLTPMTPAT